MGEALIVRRGGNVFKKRTLLGSATNIDLQQDNREYDDIAYQDIFLTNPINNYSTVELEISGSLGSSGGLTGGTNNLILYIKDGSQNLMTIRTEGQYGSGHTGSESISGTYSLTIPDNTSNKIRLSLTGLYYADYYFKGNVYIYGIPK